jgi:CRP/FNR family transcriptional regulator
MTMPKKNNSAQEVHCQACGSRSKSIFCELHSEEINALDTNKESTLYKKGQVIFNEGSRPRGLFCVNSGKIKVSKTGDEGKEHILHLAKAGDVMGYRAILSGDTYSCTATALEDSIICFVPRTHFFNMVEENGKLSMQVIKLLSEELKTAEKSITDLAQKPVRERLAEALLFLKETYGFEEDEKTINVKMTREELANVIGTATESAIRLLSEMNKERIIELDGKKIKILNLQSLVRTANLYD